MAIIARCTHCRTPLRVPETMGGKKAKCPKCGEVFQVAASAEEDGSTAMRAAAPRSASHPSSAALSRSPAAARRRVRRDDEDDDERSPRPKRRRRQQASNQGLIIGLGVGGGVLMMAMIVISVAFAARVRLLAPAPAPQIAQAVAPIPPQAPVPAAKAEPAPAPQPVEVPVAIAKVEKPAPAPADADPPPPAERPRTPPKEPPSSLLGGKLEPGTRITVRAEIQGSPPNFQGDFNKHVIQNLEIALRDLGYEPVPEGGLILQVRAQINPTGKTITVRAIGAPPRPIRPIPRAGQPLAPPANREQSYPLEQITATLVLTDMRGSALWKNDLRSESHMRIFHTPDPPTEMREQMWHMFDAWAHGTGIATMK